MERAVLVALVVGCQETAPHAGRCAPTLLGVGLCAGTATSTFTFTAANRYTENGLRQR